MPKPNKVDLGSFEGLDVVQSSIKVTNAGDGLSPSMALDPVLLHIGDEVTVVLRTTVTSISAKGVKDTDVLERVHTLKAKSGAIIDDTLVAKLFDEQQRRLEAAAGVQRLEIDD